MGTFELVKRCVRQPDRDLPRSKPTRRPLHHHKLAHRSNHLTPQFKPPRQGSTSTAANRQSIPHNHSHGSETRFSTENPYRPLMMDAQNLGWRTSSVMGSAMMSNRCMDALRLYGAFRSGSGCLRLTLNSRRQPYIQTVCCSTFGQAQHSPRHHLNSLHRNHITLFALVVSSCAKTISLRFLFAAQPVSPIQSLDVYSPPIPFTSLHRALRSLLSAPLPPTCSPPRSLKSLTSEPCLTLRKRPGPTIPTLHRSHTGCT